MPATVEPVTILLGPAARGAPDELRPAALEGVARRPGGRTLVMTQQLADRPVADRLLMAGAADGSSVQVLVESEFLGERSPDPGADPWTPHGANEPARQAFAALLRAGIPVRSDYVAARLMHSNVAVRLGPDATDGDVMVTSANLTPGSLDRHYNGLVLIRDHAIAEVLHAAFLDAWDGDFRRSARTASTRLSDGGTCAVVAGADGATASALAERIATARSSIRLAIFAFAVGNPLFTAIEQALARGVAVRGVVDGDQAAQPWDAVAPLQALGADLRYHPGARTGAPGRMHHKMLVFDDEVLAIGTANFSRAALESHETFVFLTPAPGTAAPHFFVAYAGAELDRLHASATVQPPALTPTG